MRQLLDVTNTLTFEELRDCLNAVRVHITVVHSPVKTPGKQSFRSSNQLCLPTARSRVALCLTQVWKKSIIDLGHFSLTGRGVINRGDSLKSRRQ
ncbi:hypothetical protein CVS40_10197 [Lucilia cuprina]|nr:hypothetical protein CVS40_10197 [Lucilia cuprina]